MAVTLVDVDAVLNTGCHRGGHQPEKQLIIAATSPHRDENDKPKPNDHDAHDDGSHVVPVSLSHRLTREEWKNVLLLALGWCLGTAATFVQINTSSVAVAAFESSRFGTLPLGCLMAVTSCCGPLVQRLLVRYPIRRVYFLAAVSGAVASGIQCVAAYHRSFALLTVGATCQGVAYACNNSYRLTVMNAVPAPLKARAVSYVMAGGTFAVLGPELAKQAKDAVLRPFVGSYMVAGVLYLVSALFMLFLSVDRYQYTLVEKPTAAMDTELLATSTTSDNPIQQIDDLSRCPQTPPRSLKTIALQPKYVAAVLAAAVSYATMAGLMSTTPLAMGDDKHSFDDSTLAIQMHIIGMFLPALITSDLIRKYGTKAMTIVGFLIIFVGGVIFFLSSTVAAYCVGIALVGVGWAFSFIAATALLITTFTPTEKAKAQGLNEAIMLSMLSIFVVAGSFSLEGLGWDLFVGAQLLTVLVATVAVIVLLR